MTAMTTQFVWLLLSYLATKFASKTWGRVALQVGRGYLASKATARERDLVSRIDGTRPLTPEERARLSEEERRVVDHEPNRAA